MRSGEKVKQLVLSCVFRAGSRQAVVTGAKLVMELAVVLVGANAELLEGVWLQSADSGRGDSLPSFPVAVLRGRCSLLRSSSKLGSARTRGGWAGWLGWLSWLLAVGVLIRARHHRPCRAWFYNWCCHVGE